MNFNERELEDWLFELPEALGVNRWIGRQLTLPSGVLDLLGVIEESFHTELVVVELKAVPINASAILQVCRYAADLAKTYGVQGVTKKCVGIGSYSDELQFAADAVEVHLHTVEASFDISSRWVWTDAAKQKHRETLIKAVKCNPELRLINLKSVIAKSLDRCMEKCLHVPTSLIWDLGQDYEGFVELSYSLKLWQDAIAEQSDA